MADRPFVILNLAASLDGRIALRGKRPLKLSSEDDFARLHRLRSDVDAILVGVETVLADDPKLTVNREYVANGRDPLRIVLDSRGRTPPGASVLDGRATTLVVTAEESTAEFPPAETIRCGEGRVALPPLLRRLHDRGIRTLLVEGGGTVAGSFLREGFVDRFHLYFAPVVLADPEAPSLFSGSLASHARDLFRMHLRDVTLLGGGLLLTLDPAQGARDASEDDQDP